MSQFHYIGLDLETSGLSHERCAPIQLGIATGDAVFSRYIGGWNWIGSPWTIDTPYASMYEWQEQAAGLHGIEQHTLRLSPHADTVDLAGQRFIREVSTEIRNVIPVGWNVASFDFPFMAKHLPLTAGSISYRSVDINAVIFTIVESGLKDWSNGLRWEYHALREHVKDIAAQRIKQQYGRGEKRHDAGYDAVAGLYAFEALQDIINEGGSYGH